jgi:hypothetical protein
VITNLIIGRIFAILPEDKSADLGRCPSYDTEFVLVLEIKNNGESGKFYIACNLTCLAPFRQVESDDLGENFSMPRLAGERFTVAKVVGGVDRFGLLKDNWKEEDIFVKPVSVMIPEFIESGLRSTGEKIEALVAPFPRERFEW